MGTDRSSDTTTTPDRSAVTRAYGADVAARVFAKEQSASALYPTTPAAPPSAEWYPVETSIASDIDAGLEKLVPRLRWSAADAARERTNFFSMVKRTGLDQNAQFVAQLHSKFVDAQLAEQRPGLDPAAHDTALRERSEATYERLRGEWREEFDDRLGRVGRFVAADPALDALLATGVGSDYDVLNELFQHVVRVGYR